MSHTIYNNCVSATFIRFYKFEGNLLSGRAFSALTKDLSDTLLSICRQRLRALTRPTKYWGPALVEHRKLVDYVENFVVDPWSEDNISTSSDDDRQTLAQAIDDVSMSLLS